MYSHGHVQRSNQNFYLKKSLKNSLFASFVKQFQAVNKKQSVSIRYVSDAIWAGKSAHHLGFKEGKQSLSRYCHAVYLEAKKLLTGYRILSDGQVKIVVHTLMYLSIQWSE